MRSRTGSPLVVSLLMLAALVSAPRVASATIICVNPLGSDGCVNSIQTAINTATAFDTINIAPGLYLETNINVTKPLTINGAGEHATIVDGGGAGEVFRLSNTVITLTGVQVRHGARGINASVGCGGTVTLAHVLVTDNSGNDGAGVFATCNVTTIIDSTITRNHAIGTPGNSGCDWGGGSGGGIASVCGGGVINLINSTVSNNTATFVGAGIVVNDTQLTIVNSTISGNSTPFSVGGGGLFIGGAFPRVTINQTTFANNTAPLAAGIFGSVNTTVRASILDNNGPECAGTIFSQGYNVVEDTTCNFTEPGDVQNVHAKLDGLENNGGPTFTHALRPGSPALNRLPQIACPPPVTDQRGVTRAQGRGCDSGAYEHERGDKYGDRDDHEGRGRGGDGDHDKDDSGRGGRGGSQPAEALGGRD